MRKIWIAITATALLLATVALYSGCAGLHFLVGSGKTVDQSFSLSDFTRISTGWTFDIQVTRSDAYSVEVTVDDNLQKYLDVHKDGDTLYIDMKNGYAYNNTHFEATVSTPRLTALDLSGASKGAISGFDQADDFNLTVSGASHATLSDMTVNKLTMEVSGASRASGDVISASGNSSLQASGASTIELSGKGVDADIESSGASTVNLTDYTVRDAHVNISGASNATVNATGTLSGDISGASRLYYLGSPALGNLNTSGASSVSHK